MARPIEQRQPWMKSRALGRTQPLAARPKKIRRAPGHSGTVAHSMWMPGVPVRSPSSAVGEHLGHEVARCDSRLMRTNVAGSGLRTSVVPTTPAGPGLRSPTVHSRNAGSGRTSPSIPITTAGLGAGHGRLHHPSQTAGAPGLEGYATRHEVARADTFATTTVSLPGDHGPSRVARTVGPPPSSCLASGGPSAKQQPTSVSLPSAGSR